MPDLLSIAKFNLMNSDHNVTINNRLKQETGTFHWPLFVRHDLMFNLQNHVLELLYSCSLFIQDCKLHRMELFIFLNWNPSTKHNIWLVEGVPYMLIHWVIGGIQCKWRSNWFLIVKYFIVNWTLKLLCLYLLLLFLHNS